MECNREIVEHIIRNQKVLSQNVKPSAIQLKNSFSKANAFCNSTQAVMKLHSWKPTDKSILKYSLQHLELPFTTLTTQHGTSLASYIPALADSPVTTKIQVKCAAQTATRSCNVHFCEPSSTGSESQPAIGVAQNEKFSCICLEALGVANISHLQRLS